MHRRFSSVFGASRDVTQITFQIMSASGRPSFHEWLPSEDCTSLGRHHTCQLERGIPRARYRSLPAAGESSPKKVLPPYRLEVSEEIVQFVIVLF